MWEAVATAAAGASEVSAAVVSSGSPLSSSSGSSSPPAASSLAQVSANNQQYHRQQQRKPSRNFPGLVKRSHMGSLASIVNNNNNNSRPSYGRSASVSANDWRHHQKRPSSLHLPVTQTLSASAAAMVSPILSVATRAINNNLEAAVTYGPPLIFPAAEFAPGNHLHQQGRTSMMQQQQSSNAKGSHATSITMTILNWGIISTFT